MEHNRAGRLIFTLSVLLMLTGQSWPLNPLVTRNPQPAGPVPPGCEQGLAPAPMPRVVVAEIPPREAFVPGPVVRAAVPPPPPSRTLRNTLEEAHAALVRNDRPAFDAALANARRIVRDYPPGAERTAAEEALRTYDDAAFLWDAQFESPFFSQNTEAFARVSRYPGFAEAVRRGLLTDDADRRFYPAAESRDFLTRVAAERLNRLGIRAPSRVARGERPPSVPSVSSTTTRSAAVSSTTPPSAAASASASPRRTPRRAPVRRAASAPSTSRKSATPAMSAPASPDPSAPARAVAASAPAASPAAAPTPAAPAPSPVAEGQPTEDVPVPADSDTALTTSATPAPATPSTATPAPAPATTTTAAPAPERRSILVPALLIAIGLGVLIVLFRVSR